MTVLRSVDPGLYLLGVMVAFALVILLVYGAWLWAVTGVRR